MNLHRVRPTMPASLLGQTCALIALLLMPWPAFCRDYYVAPEGKNSNAGTEPEPFREIRAALKIVAPGDTVLIADGTYQGFDAIDLGSPSSPITLRATGKNAVILPTTDRRNNDVNNIFISGCTNFIIDGLRTFKATSAGMRILLSPHVTVRNGVFGDNQKWGIITSHSPDLLIENNECFGSRIEHGIYVANSADRPIVRGNLLHDNSGSGLRANGDIAQGGDGIISGALFENNIIYNNGTGINGGAAINLDGLQDSIIRNNLLYNNHASGIALFKGCGAEGPKGMRILHNTIIMAAKARFNLRITDAIGPITVRNNLFYTFNKNRGILSWDTNQDAALTDSDYNLFGGGLFISPNQKDPRVSVADWMSAGHEKHSVSITAAGLESLFVNPAKNDYRLAPKSPAIDRGIALPDAPADINNVPRPHRAAPDLGAYEFADE
jgi:parallel beta-helix repeat protein